MKGQGKVRKTRKGKVMKFTLRKASDYKYGEPVEVSSMEGLKMLYEIYGYSLVIDFEEMTITIYDDYLD